MHGRQEPATGKRWKLLLYNPSRLSESAPATEGRDAIVDNCSAKLCCAADGGIDAPSGFRREAELDSKRTRGEFANHSRPRVPTARSASVAWRRPL